MPIEMLVYFVSEEEYANHLKTKKPFKPNYDPNFKLSQVVEFDMYSGVYRIFHTGAGHLRALHERDIRSTGNINDFFEKGKRFYITSNGITFYKIIDIYAGVQQLLELSLLLMTQDTYVESNRAFMIMPFRNSSLTDFYNEKIKTLLASRLGVSIFRADDFSDNDVIVDTIYREIEKAEFIICEITECNKNVFFEIGYAKAKSKELIFLLQRGVEHNFFDVAHIRRIDYDIDNPKEMQARLIDTIEHIRGKR